MDFVYTFLQVHEHLLLQIPDTSYHIKSRATTQKPITPQDCLVSKKILAKEKIRNFKPLINFISCNQKKLKKKKQKFHLTWPYPTD